MGTLENMLDAEHASHPFEWCQPAIDNYKRPTAEIYSNPVRAEYWVHILSQTNRAKAEELVRTMMQRLLDKVDSEDKKPARGRMPGGRPDPTADAQAFYDWYQGYKKRGIATYLTALNQGCLFLLGQDSIEDMEHALCINSFINQWVAAWNDLTGDEEVQAEADLRAWVQTQVTEAEWLNGHD